MPAQGINNAPLRAWKVKFAFLAVFTVVVLLALQLTLPERRFENLPVHSSIESFGSIISLFMAGLLIMRFRSTSWNSVGVGLGFFSLGFLNGLHGLVHTGEAFVGLHSMALLLGGIGFSLILLDGRAFRHFRLFTNGTIFILVILIGVGSILFEKYLPALQSHSHFTPLSNSINILAGLFFSLSIWGFIKQYVRESQILFLAMAYVAILYALSGFLFYFSSIWTYSWWLWHVLQLTGAILLLWMLLMQIIEIERLQAIQAEQLRFQSKSLSALNSALVATNEELKQFAYVASHDLRSPLRAIKSLSQWLQQDLGDSLPEESAEHLRLMQARVDRMEKLLDSLLNYSRVGRTVSETREVNIDEMISDIFASIKDSESFNLIKRDLPTYETYSVVLGQVFQNLFENAIRHSGDTGTTIIASARDSGDHYEFSVEDDGPGIPTEFRKKVFEMFQTLRPRDEVEGSGMGLAIVKKAVEHHGGRVWIEDATPHGAKFIFTWPHSPVEELINE